MDVAWLIGGVTAGVPLVGLIYMVGRSRQQILDLVCSIVKLNNKIDSYCIKNDEAHEIIKKDVSETKASVSTAASRISRIEGYMNGQKNSKGD